MKKITLFFILFWLFLAAGSSFANTTLWTKDHARLQEIKTTPGKNINWIFLPGGPGLGSDYLRPFVENLNLPGTLWLLDLPDDGSNRLREGKTNFDQWPIDLTHAVEKLDNVILVAHSFGGMLTLATPELQGHLKGLVLLDAAPTHQWMQASGQFQSPAIIQAQKNYLAHPSDKNLKAFTRASAPYFFGSGELKKGKKLLEHLPYNHLPFDWAMKSFDPSYQARWIPQDIPVLILIGSKDTLTPPQLFENDPRFQRSNIVLKIIPGAAHFSWVGHQKTINDALQTFSNRVRPDL